MSTTSVLLPMATYPAGTRAFGPVVVPVGVTSARCSIDRTSLLSPSLQINWNFELSQDGGASWLPWGAAGTAGGSIVSGKTGLPFTESNFEVEFPFPANTQRRLRGTVTLSEDATTSVSVTTLP